MGLKSGLANTPACEYVKFTRDEGGGWSSVQVKGRDSPSAFSLLIGLHVQTVGEAARPVDWESLWEPGRVRIYQFPNDAVSSPS